MELFILKVPSKKDSCILQAEVHDVKLVVFVKVDE
jgi:hypothetical protein